ncbi:MAG: four helix bundle protein [Planctomycetes bacterium]|nr:four helix bundle protein [Planctomycetota bacterium]
MKGDDISDRLLDLAVRVMRLVQALPRSIGGKHVASQLLRSGTSAGANYEEARGAESRADFIHKLGVAWKETRETFYWLKLIHRSALIKPKLVESLLAETEAMSKILARSISTAKKNRPGNQE